MFFQWLRSLALAIVLGTSATSVIADEHQAGTDTSRLTSFAWNGFYAGTHSGYAWGQSATTGTSADSFADPQGFGFTIDTDTDGAFFGGQVGYNVQSGALVVGVEVDFGYLNVEGSEFGDPTAGSNTVADTAIETEYGFYSVLAGRVGYATRNVLIYGKAGLALADVTHAAGDIDLPGDFDPNDTTRTARTEMGYVLGGGAEFAVGSGWSIKGEYLFFDFGTEASSDPDGNTYDTELELHTFKVGINRRF